MAEVPYGGGIPQVAPEGRPPDDYQHIRAEPDQFGALIGQGLEKAGQGLKQTGENLFDIHQFQDKVDADDQVNGFDTRRNHVLTGDPSKTTMGADGKPVPDLGYLGLEGRAAADKRAETLKALSDARDDGRKNLKSPTAQLEYDRQTRRMYTEFESKISAHAEAQWKNWAGGVNQAGALHSLNSFTANLDNPTEARAHASDYIHFKVQQAQIKYGNDPTINQQAEEEARRDLLKAQVEAIGVKEPARAIQILDKNKGLAGTQYDNIYNGLRSRATQQEGITVGATAIAQARTGMPSTLIMPAHWDATAVERARGVDPGLMTVVKRASEISGIPFTIGDKGGMRDQATQDQLVGQGFSQTRNSNHLSGNAIDLLPVVNGKANPNATPQQSAEINRAMKQASQELGTTVNWGGDWQNFKDVAHYELPRGQTPTTAPAIKADAYKMVLDNPDLSPEARQHAITYINQTMNAQEIADNQTARKKADDANHAAGGYTTRMFNMLGSPNQDWEKLYQEINNDPALADHWQVKNALMERVVKRSGAEQVLTFGPKFFETKQAMLSEPGAPGHIADLTDIYRLPPGDLTPAGEHELATVWGASRKSPDAYAVEKTKTHLESYAHSKLSFHGEFSFPGMPPKRDTDGEEIFNARFIPKFNAAYNAWIKQGKDPWQFLTQKNVDEMLTGMRNKSEMDSARLAAGGDAAGEKGATPNQPMPATPEGVNPAGWVPIVSKPPLTESGKPWPMKNWADMLDHLRTNPTPENKEAFNARFSKAGLNADDVLGKFKSDDQGDIGAQTNLDAAKKEMNLTPQEEALYQRHLTNLTGTGGVDNPDGSRSTLYQAVQEHDGKFYNIPTVWNGKREVEKWTDPKTGKIWDVPNKTALENVARSGWDKFPSYSTAEKADERYEQMHKFMERDTGTYLQHRQKPAAAPSSLWEEGRTFHEHERGPDRYTRPGGGGGPKLPLNI